MKNPEIPKPEVRAAVSPEQILLAEELRKTLEGVINELNPKEAEVVRLRFFEQKNWNEVAREAGLSRQRVVEICGIALKRLRYNGFKILKGAGGKDAEILAGLEHLSLLE